jgi:hypothetical protein
LIFDIDAMLFTAARISLLENSSEMRRLLYCLLCFRQASFPNCIDPIAILNDFVGRDQRTAEVARGRDDGSVGRVADDAQRYRFE